MILFLLFSIPLTFLLVNHCFNNYNIKKRAIALPFFYGMFLSIPILLLYWAFFDSFVNSWSSAGLYFHSFLNRDGIFALYIVTVLLCYFLFVEKPQKAERLREITAIVMGLFFSIALYDSLAAEAWYGHLELFILPINRISTVFLISLLISRTLKSYDWWKYFWIGLAVAVPFLMVFLPVMFLSNLSLISVVLSILLLVGSSSVYVLESKGRLFF